MIFLKIAERESFKASLPAKQELCRKSHGESFSAAKATSRYRSLFVYRVPILYLWVICRNWEVEIKRLQGRDLSCCLSDLWIQINSWHEWLYQTEIWFWKFGNQKFTNIKLIFIYRLAVIETVDFILPLHFKVWVLQQLSAQEEVLLWGHSLSGLLAALVMDRWIA